MATKIEWTRGDDGTPGMTWNIVTGCTRVSSGCDRCYIERTVPFRTAGRKFDKPGVGGTTGVQLHPERLDWPLRWRKPRKVFVPSLADLWHKDVPDDLIVDVFAVMALTPQHIYQNPTKRPARMRSLLSSADFWYAVGRKARHLGYHYKQAANHLGSGQNIYDTAEWETRRHLDNVWLGVSIEDQAAAELRIPALYDTPAAVRFLSCEPLLGPIDLTRWLDTPLVCGCGGEPGGATFGCSAECMQRESPGIDWVIAGGESGPGARPMHPNWARVLRDQCGSAGVAYFFKQWGEWRPSGAIGLGSVDPSRSIIVGPPQDEHGCGLELVRIGKHKAGRELDGRTWDEFPATVAT